MTTISNNKFRGAACKHVEVELIISLGKFVRGASPQDVGHQVVTLCRERPKIVSSPAPFRVRGAWDETRPKIVSTTERLGQCSLERRLTFEEEPEFDAKAKVD